MTKEQMGTVEVGGDSISVHEASRIFGNSQPPWEIGGTLKGFKNFLELLAHLL